MAVSSRCEWQLTRPGRSAASPKSSTAAPSNFETSSARAPTPTMRVPPTATAPSSIASEEIGSTHRAA